MRVTTSLTMRQKANRMSKKKRTNERRRELLDRKKSVFSAPFEKTNSTATMLILEHAALVEGEIKNNESAFT